MKEAADKAIAIKEDGDIPAYLHHGRWSFKPPGDLATEIRTQEQWRSYSPAFIADAFGVSRSQLTRDIKAGAVRIDLANEWHTLEPDEVIELRGTPAFLRVRYGRRMSVVKFE